MLGKAQLQSECSRYACGHLSYSVLFHILFYNLLVGRDQEYLDLLALALSFSPVLHCCLILKLSRLL